MRAIWANIWFILMIVALLAIWRWAYHCDHNINSRWCPLQLVNLLVEYPTPSPVYEPK